MKASTYSTICSSKNSWVYLHNFLIFYKLLSSKNPPFLVVENYVALLHNKLPTGDLLVNFTFSFTSLLIYLFIYSIVKKSILLITNLKNFLL